MSRNTCLAALLAASACGPTAPMTTETSGDASSSSGASASTTTTNATSTSTTAEPTTGASSSASGSDSSGGQMFITPTDFHCAAAHGARCFPCSLWQQDCGPGNKCAPWSSSGSGSWDQEVCTPVDRNPDHAGDPCTTDGEPKGHDSCDATSVCLHGSGTTEGVCTPLCMGTQQDPICPDGTTCVIANDGVFTLCLPNCDPLAPACAGTDICIPHPSDPGFVCVTDASGADGQLFGACSFINGCDPGLHCADPAHAVECDPMGDGCCLPYCDLTMPTCPGAMQECLPWFDPDPAPPGLEKVGACMLPP